MPGDSPIHQLIIEIADFTGALGGHVAKQQYQFNTAMTCSESIKLD